MRLRPRTLYAVSGIFLLALLIWAAFFIPIGTYNNQNCLNDLGPTHLVWARGQSISKVKQLIQSDESTVGTGDEVAVPCFPQNHTFKEYIL